MMMPKKPARKRSAEKMPPIAGLFVLDDGMEPRYYYSAASLAVAIVSGYARTTSAEGYRQGSLQWFGRDGYCDLSDEFLNLRSEAENHKTRVSRTVVLDHNVYSDVPFDGCPKVKRDAWRAARKSHAKAVEKRIVAFCAETMSPVSKIRRQKMGAKSHPAFAAKDR